MTFVEFQFWGPSYLFKTHESEVLNKELDNVWLKWRIDDSVQSSINN